MIKAGIFDVGGVLLTNETAFIYEDIIKTLAITPQLLKNGLNQVLGSFMKGEVTEEEFWRNFIDYTKASGKIPVKSLYGREYERRFKKNENVLSLINKIKTAGYKLAVLSDTITPHVEFNRKNVIYDNFDVEVLSNKVGMIKPDPKIFIYTLEKLKVEPGEAFFVDDVEINVNAANSLGIHGIKYGNYDKLEKDLNNLRIKF